VCAKQKPGGSGAAQGDRTEAERAAEAEAALTASAAAAAARQTRAAIPVRFGHQDVCLRVRSVVLEQSCQPLR